MLPPLRNTSQVVRLDEYLEALASARPTPGGGSAAMLVGAAGCALVAMVARICLRSDRYARVHSLARRIVRQADALRTDMLDRRLRDEAAFEAVVKAKGNPRAVQRALRVAAEVPLEGALGCLQLLRTVAQAVSLGNRNLASDTGCAAEFAMAGLAACAYNVRVNHRFLENSAVVAKQRAQLERCEREAAALVAGIRKAARAELAP